MQFMTAMHSENLWVSIEEYIELLDEIPGIGRRSAERIIAESGEVMTRF